MFRYITTILLIAAFAAQTFQQAFIVLDYYTRTASFAKYCENKAQPMMHCNGKCQMMKKLKEEEKKDQQNPERKSENKHGAVSSQSFFATLLLPQINSPQSFRAFYVTSFPKGIHSDIFHPPGLV